MEIQDSVLNTLLEKMEELDFDALETWLTQQSNAKELASALLLLLANPDAATKQNNK